MMPRFIRRKSDSLTFTVLWWIAFFTCVTGLTYYAYKRAVLVASRAFVLQTTTVFYSNDNDTQWVVPDIMVCTHNATLSIGSLPFEFYHEEYPVGANADLTPQQKQLSPCYENKTTGPYFDKLHIISANKTAAASSPGASIMNIMFTPDPSATNTTLYANSWFYLYVVPAENNPYKATGLRPGPYNGPDPNLVRNMHVGLQDATSMYITAYTTRTRVLDTGFRGLFGYYNESATDVFVTSQSEGSYVPGSFWIGYYLPSMKVNNSEVLTTSIPDALSSFGGAFSIIVGLFYVFFGHGRVSPFGLVQKFLLRRQTKRNLRKVYGNWKQDKDGHYYEARSSNSSSPTNSPYGSNVQDSFSSRRQHRHRPSSFSSMNTLTDLERMDIETKDHPTSYQGPPLSSYERPSGHEGDNNHRLQQGLGASPLEDSLDPQLQQFRACQQELIEMREQMRRHARVLKYLQRHEQRFKDTETLLNEYYLDMDLVETGGDSPSMAELSEDVTSLSKDMAPDFKPPTRSPTVLGKFFSVFGNRQPTTPFKATPSSFDPLQSLTGMGAGGSNSRLGWNGGFQRMNSNDEESYMLVQHGGSPGTSDSANGDNRSSLQDLSRMSTPTRIPSSNYSPSQGYI